MKKYCAACNTRRAPHVASFDSERPVTDFERRTVLQDHYILRFIMRSGADKLLPSDSEDATVFVMRVQSCIVGSGKACEMLAGLLIPADSERWSPDVAKKIASRLAALDNAVDRETVSLLCVDLAFNYFRENIAKIARSQISMAEVDRTVTGAATH